MVNAVSKSSRLIGCYHHHPHVIPLPSTTSIQLTEDDEFLVIANAPFWACISHREAVTQVRNVADSKMAAGKLRDLALAYGSKEEICIIVVRFLNSHFVPQHRKLATSQHSDVRASRPKTIHGESGLHYSTTSLGRIKHREPVDAENLLQRRTKSIYSVTTQPQPQQTFPSLDNSPGNGNSQVAMRKTKSGNECHQKALSSSPDQIPIHSSEWPEHTNVCVSPTNYADTSKGSSWKTKAVAKKKTTESNNKLETKYINSNNDKKSTISATSDILPASSNGSVSQSKQKNVYTNPTNYVVTAKGSLQETEGIRKKKTSELNNKTDSWRTKQDSHKKTASSTLNSASSSKPISQLKQKTVHASPNKGSPQETETVRKKTTPELNKIGGWDTTKDHLKKSSSATPDQISSTNNKQVTQPQLNTVHINPTNSDMTKKIKSQPNTEKQHKTDHINDHHEKAKSAATDMTPPANRKPVVHSQDHAATNDQIIPAKLPDSQDKTSSFNVLRHSSSDSLADQSLADQSANQSLLNQSMDATWFESIPPLQLDDGLDTFGLELGMLSDMPTNFSSEAATENVVFGGQKDWGANQYSNKQPAPSVMDKELEEAKANFNFDDLIAGLNSTWMTTLDSIPNTTPSVNTETKSPMKRDDSILSDSLMAQFEQEANEELDNLISQLNEFVDDPIN